MTDSMRSSALVIPYALFLILSWITTALGLTVFLPLGFALGISGAASMAMGLLAPRLVPRWYRKTDWVFSSIGYLILTTLSILFASTFYFQQLSGAGLEQQRLDEGEQALLSSLGTLRQHYQILAAKLDELAEYSRQQAEEEERKGGTCAASKGAGHGPLWAMRQWQGQEFQHAAQRFRRIQEQLEQEIQGLIALVEASDRSPSAKQKDLQRLATRLEAYNQRPDVQRLLERLTAQGDYQRNGYPRDNQYCYRGVCFGGHACGDGTLGTLIDDIRAIGLPQVHIPAIQRYDAGDLRQNLSLVLTLWGDILGFTDSGLAIEGDRAFSLAMGTLVDAVILILGFILGMTQRAHPMARLDAARLHLLMERLEDIRRHYPEVFPSKNLPKVPRGSVDDQLHRIQQVLDIVSRPAGQHKIILLPANPEGILKSRGRLSVDNRSERRLEAVIEVVNALSQHRLLGEPIDKLRNRYTRYQGYDRETLAAWYGLEPDSVQYFSVFIIDPDLMLDATALGGARLELPWHLAVQRRNLRKIRPTWFKLEDAVLEQGCDNVPPAQLAAALLARTEDVRPIPRAQGEDGDTPPPDAPQHEATVTLYPQLFALDHCLERLLLDDDHGLHRDLEEISQRRRFSIMRHLRPYRRFRLGPRSYAALLTLVDSDGQP